METLDGTGRIAHDKRDQSDQSDRPGRRPARKRRWALAFSFVGAAGVLLGGAPASAQLPDTLPTAESAQFDIRVGRGGAATVYRGVVGTANPLDIDNVPGADVVVQLVGVPAPEGEGTSVAGNAESTVGKLLGNDANIAREEADLPAAPPGGWTARLSITRLKPGRFPVSIEALYQVDDKRVGFGYDAQEASTLPSHWVATAVIPPISRADGWFDLELDSEEPGDRLAVLGSLVTVDDAGQPAEQISARLGLEPVPATTQIKTAWSAGKQTVTVRPSTPVVAQGQFHVADASGTVDMEATVEKLPTFLQLESSASSYTYRSNATVDRISLNASVDPTERAKPTFSVSGTLRDVRAREMVITEVIIPSRMASDPTADQRLTAYRMTTAGGHIGTAEVGAAWGDKPEGEAAWPALRTDVPQGTQYLNLVERGERRSVAARILGLTGAQFQSSPVSLQLSHAGGPLQLFGILRNGETLTGSLRNLPPVVHLTFSPETQHLTYEAAGNDNPIIGEVSARVRAAEGRRLFGDVRQVDVLVRDLPDGLDFTLSRDGGGVSFDTRGKRVGLVDVHLTSHPERPAPLPAGTDGVRLIEDGASSTFILHGRITGLRKVKFQKNPRRCVDVDPAENRSEDCAESTVAELEADPGRNLLVHISKNATRGPAKTKVDPDPGEGFEEMLKASIDDRPSRMKVELRDLLVVRETTDRRTNRPSVKSSPRQYVDWTADRSGGALHLTMHDDKHWRFQVDVTDLAAEVHVCSAKRDNACTTDVRHANQGSFTFEAFERRGRDKERRPVSVNLKDTKLLEIRQLADSAPMWAQVRPYDGDLGVSSSQQCSRPPQPEDPSLGVSSSEEEECVDAPQPRRRSELERRLVEEFGEHYPVVEVSLKNARLALVRNALHTPKSGRGSGRYHNSEGNTFVFLDTDGIDLTGTLVVNGALGEDYLRFDLPKGFKAQDRLVEIDPTAPPSAESESGKIACPDTTDMWFYDLPVLDRVDINYLLCPGGMFSDFAW